MHEQDTIAALCTGPGGALAVLRISGPMALSVGSGAWRGGRMLSSQCARQLLLGNTVHPDGSIAGPALAVYMPAPHSYTGEDVVEIHCHGGSLCAQATLAILLSAGARAARPGEFTCRAFLNGKMDLTQAEAVADIISANSRMALQLAERQLSGLLGGAVRDVRNVFVELLAECESRLDFGEEELDWQNPSVLGARLEQCAADIRKLLATKSDGILLREGIRVVIAGLPNTGKSSLLNRLLGFERAIVTQIPGTTRDTIEESASLRNIPVRLVDTAGLREADDLIEKMGIARSHQSLAGAQIVLWVLDSSSPDPSGELAEMQRHLSLDSRSIAVWNKSDMRDKDAARLPVLACPAVEVSALSGAGIPELLDAFERTAWGFPHESAPDIAVSSRHAALLEDALSAIPEAQKLLASASWELFAVSLRAAISSLGQITGEDLNPDILDSIFSRFCIGK